MFSTLSVHYVFFFRHQNVSRYGGAVSVLQWEFNVFVMCFAMGVQCVCNVFCNGSAMCSVQYVLQWERLPMGEQCLCNVFCNVQCVGAVCFLQWERCFAMGVQCVCNVQCVICFAMCF